MRNLRIISAILVFLALGSSVQARTGDWQAIKNLPPGSRISVKVRVRLQCIFESATDDELVCKPIHRSPFPWAPSPFRFQRQRVREVRLEHSEAFNMATGAAVGASVGAAIGASSGNGTLTRGGGALLLGGIGGIIGGFFGSDFPILHGKVVYHR